MPEPGRRQPQAPVRWWPRGRLRRQALLSLAQGLVSVLAYLLAMRLLIGQAGTAAVGLWSLVLGLTALLRLADVFGGSGLARLLAQADAAADKHALLDSVSLISLALYGAGALLLSQPLAQLAAWLAPEAGHAAAALMPLALALLVAGVIANLQMAALDGLGLADRRAILSLLSTAGFAWLALWAIPRWGVAGLAAAQLAQMLLQVLAGRFLLCRALPGLPALPRRFARAALAPALAQGLRLQGSLLPLLIYEPLARVIIAQGAGLQVLAHYDLAYKLSLYARMMLQAAATPLLPELARRQTADIGAARALAARADLWLGWLALAVLGLTLLAAPAISLILFDAVLPDFLAAVGLLSLAFAVASRGLAGALWAQASGRMGWTIAGQWLIAALTLGLSLPAGRLLGPQAMVAGMALALAAGYGLAFWGNRAQMQGPRPDLHWPARKVAP